MHRKYTNAVVSRFEQAVKEHALRHIQNLNDTEYNEVIDNYRRAKQALTTMIDRLNSQPQKGEACAQRRD